jgi:class 3 adenylate cyclase
MPCCAAGVLPETRYARRGDVHVAYQVVGEADVDLVLVSAWFSHVEARWELPTLAHFLRRLAGFSRLISFDKVGIGLSDPLPPDHLLPLEEWMDDVRTVMDEVGSERAVILGADEGGMMAAMFAATYPERTKALVLANTTARLSWAPDYPIGLAVEAQEALTTLIDQTWGTPQILLATSPSIAQDVPRHQTWARFLRLSASPATASAVIRMLLQLDVRDVLPTIRVPTLVIHRRENPIMPVAHGRYLAERIARAEYVEVPGMDYGLGAGNVDVIADEVQEFVTGGREDVSPHRVLATVLFTDIVDSTKVAAELGDRLWQELVETHEDLARRQLSRYGGSLIKTTGDGVLAIFDGPARAIRCALRLREAVARLGVEIRAGLHAGEIERMHDDVRGIAVHIASRVQALASGSEVLVSRTVKDLVAGAEFTFSEHGTHRLKGVPDEWAIFRADG